MSGTLVGTNSTARSVITTNCSRTIWMTLPKSCVSAKHADKQITRIMRALGKWVGVKSLKCQRHEILQANILTNRDAQILNSIIPQRNSMQTMTLLHQMRVECRLAPIFAVKLLQCLAAVELFHGAQGGLTTKAEPPPIRGSRKTKATGDGGWLRRLVRPLASYFHIFLVPEIPNLNASGLGKIVCTTI